MRNNNIEEFDDLVITQEDIEASQQQDIENQEQNKKKKPNKAVIIVVSIICALLIAGGATGYYFYNQKCNTIYSQACSLMDDKQYESAIGLFEGIKSFKDAKDKYDECQYNIDLAKYNSAMELKNIRQYKEAAAIFDELGDFEDSRKQSIESLAIERSLYVKYLGTELYKINKYKELSMSVINIVSTNWRVANASGADVTATLKQTYSDWGDTLKKLNDGYDGLRIQVNDISELESASEAYDKFMEIYKVYLEIHECAVAPSGELNDYIKNVNDYSQKFDKLVKELYTMENEIKQQVQEEEALNLEKEIQGATLVITE